jgi:hypothetical protein
VAEEIDDTLPEGGEGTVAPEEAQAPEQQQPDELQPSPYDDLAKKMGWVPKDQYKGDPERWRPAEDFILAGRDIQQQTSRELKEIKHTLQTVTRTTASIAEQRIAEERARLSAEYERAVEDGDAKTARQVGQQLDRLEATPATPPPPETQSWTERNAGWFQKNPAATARAFEVCDRLAKLGYGHTEQLQAAEEEVKRTYPELFADQRQPAKQQASVNTPSRDARQPARAKGFHDLPKAAQDVAIDMANRGVVRAEGNLSAQEVYARNYFAQMGN